jgi:cytidyltransferase-like protein
MLIDIRVRTCINIQFQDIRLENIGGLILENSDAVVCIYKGEEYYANIDRDQMQLLSSQEELLKYLEDNSGRAWVNGFELDTIKETFDAYKNVTLVFLEKPEIYSEAVWTANKVCVGDFFGNVDFSVYMKLKQKDIRTYIVNLPNKIKNVYGIFSKMYFIEYWMKESKGGLRKFIERQLKRITDLTSEEYFARVLDTLEERCRGKQLGTSDADRTIYLIGPCIVEGWTASEQSMAEILIKLLEKYGLPYKIVKISTQFFPNEILEYDIFENDIVIFLGADLPYKDYDLTEDYESYNGDKNLCTNHPLHVSKTGCTLIANALMNDIIIPNNNHADVAGDKQVLHIAEKQQLDFEMEYELKMYLKQTNIPRHMRKGNNGAIVMNANPFTIGHRRLVEYASAKVDRLYIFVVEEDASFFSFEERFDMVVQGIKDISNVIVLPSGNFIISNKTFYSYFTKDIDNGSKIDASQDILIFARYIVPYFGITKRFVGDEPLDKITAQYNEQMKKILPYYGCELIEILRLKNRNSVVSGGAVRKAIQEKDIDTLRHFLPKTSFEYIYKCIDILQNRNIRLRKNNHSYICCSERMFKIQEIIECIKQGNVVIYGIGNDTVQLMKLLSDEDKEKLIFTDKQAEESEIIFMGRKILAPGQLKERYLDYTVLILSSVHYKEIYSDCMDLGIAKERIKYNPYNLYACPEI